MLVADDFLDGFFEVVEALAARVALVAFHDSGPLMRGHGACAGVCEQVDQNVFGGKQKQIVKSGFQQLLALLARGPANGFYGFYAEGFDNGFDGHGPGFDTKIEARNAPSYLAD